MRFIVFCGLATLGSLLLGQIRVSGKVIDANTKDPLAFAHVGILSTTLGTITNASGEFSILITEKYTNPKLGISYLGYAPFITSVPLASDLIELEPSEIRLPFITISDQKRDLIDEAIALIPKNHDQGDLKMRAFWRAMMRSDSLPIQLTESVFDIVRLDDQDEMEILKGRSARDSIAFKPIRNFNAGVTPKSLFASSFLRKQGILSGKSLRLHEFRLEELTVYNDRPVFVIEFDKKAKHKDHGYAGRILLDSETLAFVKISFGFSPGNQGKQLVYNNFLYKKITGLGNSIWNRYEVDLNYQLVNGKWYFSHGSYDVDWTLIDNKETFGFPVSYRADFVATEISKSNIELPEKSNRAGRQILVNQASKMGKDFWNDFTYLVPDENLDRIFEQIEMKNTGRSSDN